jgi:hypothetical protein
VSDLALDGLRRVWRHLGLPEPAIDRSSTYGNQELAGPTRVIDICKRERARVYVNSIGGRNLYDAAQFAEHGITLKFLKADLPEYRQFNQPFVQGLSIIDTLMFNPPAAVASSLDAYHLS